MNTTTSSEQPTALPIRIAAAWVLALVALTFAGWAGDYLVASYDIGSTVRFGLQAAIMSGIVVPGILYLRSRHDRRPFAGLAMLGLRRSLQGFGLGAGLILVPTAVTVFLTGLFGWATVSLNHSTGAFGAIATAIATAFFFEALPEELVFRGYIFRNLNTVMRRWTAGVVTVGLFVLLPIVLVQIQEHVLGMEVRIGGTNTITIGYLVILLFFGSFLVYLRVLTGTVWAGIGFHLFFLMANRIVGIHESSWIQLSDLTTQVPMQVTLIATVLLCFGALFFSPRVMKRSLGWHEVDPE